MDEVDLEDSIPIVEVGNKAPDHAFRSFPLSPFLGCAKKDLNTDVCLGLPYAFL